MAAGSTAKDAASAANSIATKEAPVAHELANAASTNSESQHDVRKTSSSSIWTIAGTVLFKGLSIVYGLQVLGFFYYRAISRGYVSSRPSDGFWKRVEQERLRLWGLGKASDELGRGEAKKQRWDVKGMEGFVHAFEDVEVELPGNASTAQHGSRTASTARLHYIINEASSSIPSTSDQPENLSTPGSRNLVILIHGWPDSSFIWRSVLLQLNSSSPTTLIAVDLPGHGGSQSLPHYGANEVLETIFHFVIAMRQKYYQPSSGARVILVGHDWGGLVCSRLAAEAPECMDDVVLTNGPLMALAMANARQNVKMSMVHLRNLDLRQAWKTAKPLLKQLMMSGYVFAYNLPEWLVSPLSVVGNAWWLRTIASFATGTRDESEEVVRSLAAIFGPSEEVVMAAEGEGGYHRSVLRRAGNQRGRFMESIRLYREGLATAEWMQSSSVVEMRSSIAAGSGRQETTEGSSRPLGALRVPLTKLWCLGDIAMSYDICVKGIEDYISSDSIIITMDETKARRMGHWTPVTAAQEVSAAVGWVVDGKQGRLVDTLRAVEAGGMGDLDVLVEKP